MSLGADARIILERLVYLERLRTVVLAGFGPAKNPRVRLRNSALTRYVAMALDREPSNALGADVIQAMRSHGWRAVRHANATWWKGITRR